MNIYEIIMIIDAAGLSRPSIFQREALEVLKRYYNGVGAYWFTEWLLKLSTLIFERMEPLAFIHDVEFAVAPRTYRAFTLANLRWAYNAIKLARYYQHGKIRFLLVAWLCALCCQLGGWGGFKREGGK